MSALVAFLALIIENIFGYPDFLQRRLRHPVEWMGALISWSEGHWNDFTASDAKRRNAGICALLVLIIAVAIPAFLITYILDQFMFGWLGEALLASTLLAPGLLAKAVRDVAAGLGDSLQAGRDAVAQIVGRDTVGLDQADVSRAAIETLAENASDGVIAPLFYLLLFGLPGLAIYKAINTADSMVGHLSERYTHFGWASARLDDVVNWVPARITAGIFVLGALITANARPFAAVRAAFKYAHQHRSPNAGWPEAAMAGALDFSLGGPRAYKGKTLDLPTMGNGKRDLGLEDLAKALQLYWSSIIVTIGLVGTLAVVLLV